MEDFSKSVSPGKVVYPILIGLGVASWMLYRNFDKDAFGFIQWTWITGVWLLVSILMMVVRDLAYIIRIRILTGNELTWKQAFHVIMLWEFSSAVSPSVVGGAGPAIYFLYKEGINSGKSTAVVLTSIFLDEVFYILLVPVMFIIFRERIFPIDSFGYATQIQSGLILGYIAVLVYTLLLAYALFINPYSFKWLLSRIFMLPILRKRRMRARKLANQLIITSNEIKGKPISYWFKSFFATMVSWFGRFSVVNFIFMAFFFSTLGLYEHALIIGRQLTMWIILLVSPTPGGSGVAEFIFSDFLGDLTPNIAYAVPLALLWRLISYYPYLFIGAFILPGWFKKVFAKKILFKKIK
jgi:uncharacterized protein (TIRG00374 family)